MPEGSNGNPAAAPSSGGTQPIGGDVIEGLKADLVAVYRAVVALDKRVSESTVNMVEIKPQLIALKVHTESFPNTLRELRRAFTSTQKAVADFEARLRHLEERMKEQR
jgi:uncharacterized coiled-coil protein SlyX